MPLSTADARHDPEDDPQRHATAPLGAKMVDFGGWDMPIHYGSQIDEHHLVRATRACSTSRT
jgi:glycine cleavage system aminomethyltransferase T